MSVIIKMKGLPFDATAKDIKSFFQSLYLREEQIHLAAYKDGRAAGIAFAVFQNDEDARKAMFRNGKYMGKRYIELFLSSSTEMNSMLLHGVPTYNPRLARDGGGEQREEGKSKGDQRQNKFEKSMLLHGVPTYNPRLARDGGGEQREEGKSKGDQRQNKFEKSSRSDRREVQPRARSRSPVSRPGNPGQEADFRDFGVWNKGSSFGGDKEGFFQLSNRGASFFEMRFRDDEEDRQDRYQRLQNEREIPRERMGNRSFEMDERDMHKERSHGKDEGGRNTHRRLPLQAKEERDRRERDERERREREERERRNREERERREREEKERRDREERERREREERERREREAKERREREERDRRDKEQRTRRDRDERERRNRNDRDRRNMDEEICCKLNGLPFRVGESDIQDFFKGFSVQKIKLLYHASGSFAGKKNGKAYVEFKSVKESREAAKKKHKQYLMSRYVEVACCTKGEMIEESNINDNALKKAQEDPRVDRESSYDSRNPISDLAIKIDPQIFNSTYGIPGLMDIKSNHQSLGLSLHNPYVSGETVDLPTQVALKQLESRVSIKPEDVTAGCVVGIRNLPSTITAEEILDFFYGFPVFTDSVRIHYLTPGRSSGDAMVTFHSSQEAAAAIQQLNHKPVGKRNIQLFLL